MAKRVKKIPKSFRISPEAIRILKNVGEKRLQTVTNVIERMAYGLEEEIKYDS